MDSTTKTIAVLNFLVFAALGAYFCFAPLSVFEDLGLIVTMPESIVEIRAMYGGLELGIAAYIAFLLKDTNLPHILSLCFFCYLGLGGLRAACMVSQRVGGLHIALLSAEILGALVNGWGLYRISRQNGRLPGTRDSPRELSP